MQPVEPKPVLDYDRPISRATSFHLRMCFGIASLLIAGGAGLLIYGIIMMFTYRYGSPEDAAIAAGVGGALFIAGLFLMAGVLWTRFSRLLR